MPPAQFTVVPLRLMKSCTSSRRCSSNTSVVVPPNAVGSYAAERSPSRPPTVPAGLRSSLLRTSRTRCALPLPWNRPPANKPMPSSASGVGFPSDILEPVWLNVT